MRRRIYKYEIVPTMDLLGMHPEAHAHVQMPREARP